MRAVVISHGKVSQRASFAGDEQCRGWSVPFCELLLCLWMRGVADERLSRVMTDLCRQKGEETGRQATVSSSLKICCLLGKLKQWPCGFGGLEAGSGG